MAAVALGAEDELAELKSLLESGAVRCAGNVGRLNKLCEELEASIAPASSPSPPSTSPGVAAKTKKEPTGAQAIPVASTALPRAAKRPAERIIDSDATFVPIESFGWDQSDKNVSIYVSGLTGVGAMEGRTKNILCDFGPTSFDLRVMNLGGKNYRLFKDNLDKSIVPQKSKVKVKAHKIVLLLRKVPGKYGSEHWTNLTAKRKKTTPAGGKADPMGGIMDLMKDMYEEGDDQMRATIGKAMTEARLGKKPKEPSMPSFDDFGGL